MAMNIKKISWTYVHKHAHTSWFHVRAGFFSRMHMFTPHARMFMHIFSWKFVAILWACVSNFITIRVLVRRWPIIILKLYFVRYLSLKEYKRIQAIWWENEPRRGPAFNMIWGHSANRDVLPGWFQPYG